jgi:hypothetical protein
MKPTNTEKANYYRDLLQACGWSVISISLGFAAFGALLGGLSGAVGMYIFAVVLAAFPMGVAALIFLPVVVYRQTLPHPEVFSLLGMLILGLFAYLATVQIGGTYTDLTLVQARFILFGVIYGFPIGSFLRYERKKRASPVSQQGFA